MGEVRLFKIWYDCLFMMWCGKEIVCGRKWKQSSKQGLQEMTRLQLRELRSCKWRVINYLPLPTCTFGDKKTFHQLPPFASIQTPSPSHGIFPRATCNPDGDIKISISSSSHNPLRSPRLLGPTTSYTPYTRGYKYTHHPSRGPKGLRRQKAQPPTTPQNKFNTGIQMHF